MEQACGRPLPASDWEMRILLIAGLLLGAAAAVWIVQPIWMPRADTALLRHIREVTARDDDFFHQIDLHLVYGTHPLPVGDLVEDLRLSGFNTDWVTNPDPQVRYLKRQCGPYYVQKDDDQSSIVVRRRLSNLEAGRDFMVSVQVDGHCVVTKAQAAWLRPNTF